jgi:uncharacterized protein (TIGR04255 family)
MAPIEYKTPPLVEAVQEFVFRPGASFSLEARQRLTSEYRKELPQESTVTVENTTLSGEAESTVTRKDLWRFTSSDGATILTMGQDSLGVSYLTQNGATPYPGWTIAHRNAIRWLKAYSDQVSDVRIAQATVRYENRLTIEPGRFVAGDYLSRESNLIAPALLGERNPFSCTCGRTTFVADTYYRYELLTVFAGLSPTEGPVLSVTIDEIAYPREQIELYEVRQRCSELHNAAHDTFGRVFTKSVLESFEPVTLQLEEA